MFRTVIEEGNRLLKFYKLYRKGWRFTTYKSRVAGLCNFIKKTIFIAEDYILVASTSQLVNTLLHEIAHALCGPGHGHGSYWKEIAKMIGCDGLARHKIDFGTFKYSIQCIKGCWKKGSIVYPKN